MSLKYVVGVHGLISFQGPDRAGPLHFLIQFQTQNAVMYLIRRSGNIWGPEIINQYVKAPALPSEALTNRLRAARNIVAQVFSSALSDCSLSTRDRTCYYTHPLQSMLPKKYYFHDIRDQKILISRVAKELVHTIYRISTSSVSAKNILMSCESHLINTFGPNGGVGYSPILLILSFFNGIPEQPS
jgi:hypothetical protein